MDLLFLNMGFTKCLFDLRISFEPTWDTADPSGSSLRNGTKTSIPQKRPNKRAVVLL